ncbi:MAG: prolipoprotein diacylglyceryl transferase [Firmicutes bacterium]|nr:prolipoprotein diacylglyceryl transferase [Bacillota bacterium]
MFPSIRLFDNDVYMYDILVNTGTLMALAVLIFLLYKYKKLNKKNLAAFAVSLCVSFPFAAILRRLMESEDTAEIFCSGGSHFMGMVFAFYFIFPFVYKKITKTAPTDDIKAISTSYFCIQHFFSRLGCYCLGCCFGKPYDGIFAVTFPYGTNPYMIYEQEIPVFPTQLFESFSMAVLIVLLAVLAAKKKEYVYFVFILLFSAVIFISEIFMYKYEYERMLGIFSLPQICAVILIICEIVKFVNLKRSNKVMK